MDRNRILAYVRYATTSVVENLGDTIRLSEIHGNLFRRISKLLDSGYQDEFKKLTESLEKLQEKNELPKKLQDKLDLLGNTPIEEPELFKKLQDENMMILEKLDGIITDEEMDEHSIEEMGSFARILARQINYLKTDDGVFKRTPNTEGWNPPKNSQIKKMQKMVHKLVKEGNKEKTELQAKNIKKLSDELDEYAFSTSGLDKNIIIDWEKDLVDGLINEAMLGFDKSFTGKK